MSKSKQAKDVVGETTEPAGVPVTGDVAITDVKAQFDELKELIADVRAVALDDAKMLAGRVLELEQTVAKLDKGKQRSFPRGTGEYEVVDGDSLVMIAKTELGQSGRFTEIATMNYDRYPGLRTSNEVEAGWKLRMPPR